MYIMLKLHRVIGIYDKINYITLTEFNKQKLLSLVKDESRIYVKPNFVEKGEHGNRQLEDYFVYIGRLDDIKGVDFLVEAWKYIDSNIRLYIIGTGPDEEKLKNIVLENKLKNIKLLGFLERKEAFKVIEKSRAVIVPSKWYEGFPMTITESFSLGVPVIGSKLGNIESIIDDKENGLLFENNNRQSLVESINQVFYNKELNINLGKNAYKVFKEKYTDEENYKIIEKIYNSLNT